jgi:protein phosphatase
LERIALIADIHGNIPAFEAVLDDIKNRDVDKIYCLGDLIGKGPHSDKAVDICRQQCDLIIQGNWEGFILKDVTIPVIKWHQQRLGSERLDFLRTLAPTIDFTISGRNVRLFHASQKGIYHRVHMHDSTETHLEMFKNTDFTGNSFHPNMVGYADIHRIFLKTFQDGETLFNVGSVGNPLDMPMASYVIMEGEYGKKEEDTFSIHAIRVKYDIELAIKQAAEEEMPELEQYADELRTARYRGRR